MSDYADWKGWDSGGFATCSATAERYFAWHVQRAFGGATRANAEILELGFGNGSFLGFCRVRGYHVTGVEPDSELLTRAAKAGFPAARDLHEIEPRQQFDLVCAFDVLEHFDRAAVEEFFARLPRLLAPGGRVLIRVPNGDSPFGRRHQHGDITHVTTFGEFKFRQLAHRSGLELQAIGESPWYVDETESMGLMMVLRAIARTVIDLALGLAYYRTRVDLAPNMVVVLRKAGAGRTDAPAAS